MTDKVPYSQQAEEALLGAVMVNPDLLLLIGDRLKPDDFFFVRHSYIWQAVNRLTRRNDAVDYMTIANELIGMGQLEIIGGPAYLTQLIGAAPTSTHGETYAEIVKRASVRRQLLEAADNIKALAHNEDLSLENVTLQSESRLLAVTQYGIPSTEQGMGEVMSTTADTVEDRYMNGTPAFVPTGFLAIDKMLGGLEIASYHVLAALTSTGKSLFSLTMAWQQAKLGLRVLLVSNEATIDKMGFRLAAMESGVNSTKLRTGKITQEEYSRFVEASGRIAKLPLWVDYQHGLTPLGLKTKIARRMNETGLDIVIVDGIYKMKHDDNYGDKRVLELENISDDMLELSRDMKIPVFCTHQVKPEVRSRGSVNKNGQFVGDCRPRGEDDLRWCSKIGIDADSLFFLHRQSMFDPTFDMPNHVEFIARKSRDNVVGAQSLYFERAVPVFKDGTVRKVDLGDVS